MEKKALQQAEEKRRRTRNIQTESEEGKNTQAEGREKDISGKKNPHQEGEEDCCCPVGKLCAIQIHLKKWQSAQDSQEVFATWRGGAWWGQDPNQAGQECESAAGQTSPRKDEEVVGAERRGGGFCCQASQ